jgi:signal transduction histidine kinase
VDVVIMVAAGLTLQNTVFSDNYYPCASFRPPMLPGSSGCGYNGAQTAASLIGMAIVLLLMVYSWWLLAGWVLSPLSQTARTVRLFGPQNLSMRLRLASGDDALKELADALDDALDRLVVGYEGQRRFASNASHELRTPLAVQRLLAEVAMEDPAAGEDVHRLGRQLLRANEHNERLIEGLLVLAESDRGLPGKVPVRLDELAAKVLDAHQEHADQHQVTLRRKLAETEVPGDPVLLERLIANLVSNAVKYNEPGGWVEVVVADGTTGPALAVQNTGDVVPADAVATIFEPFRRLGTERVRGRGGVGLGLTIVSSIVTAHDGTIRVRPRREGGLDLEIRLPGRPDQQALSPLDRGADQTERRGAEVEQRGVEPLERKARAPSRARQVAQRHDLQLAPGVPAIGWVERSAARLGQRGFAGPQGQPIPFRVGSRKLVHATQRYPVTRRPAGSWTSGERRRVRQARLHRLHGKHGGVRGHADSQRPVNPHKAPVARRGYPHSRRAEGAAARPLAARLAGDQQPGVRRVVGG